MKKLSIFLFFIILVCFQVYPDLKTSEKEIVADRYFLSLNNEMKELLDEHVLPVKGEKRRLDKIVELIFDRSVVGFDYSSVRTYTASETFEKRTGNCLSYTAMFISMARYAGLRAKFQEVSDFLDWERRGNMIVFSTHINSVVEIGTRIYEVDFQYRSEKKFWNRKVVGDKRAKAHYFNNIGSEALLKKDYSLAEKLLRRSIDLDSSFSFVWSNLGVLFKAIKRVDEAEECFERAIILDTKNHTAKMNLAGLYESQGFKKKSDKLKDTIKKIMRMNPYYHFDLGLTEYNRQNYRDAIKNFKRAIKRDPKKSEFYKKLAAAYYKVGDLIKSKKYLKKGQKYAGSDKEKEKYQKKLEFIHIKLKQAESN